MLGLLCRGAAWACSFRTQLRAKRTEFEQVLRQAVQKPMLTPPGPSRAISSKQLRDFMDFFRGIIANRNMYFIDTNLVRPLTRRQHISYAELAGPRRVRWFVSHSWSSPFEPFVRTVTTHAKMAGGLLWYEETYWICTFSNNQWDIAGELGHGDWQQSSFYKALTAPYCAGTLLVLDSDASPLRRAWCLFEVFQTMHRTGQTDFHGLLLGTESGVLNSGTSSMDMALELAHRLSTLDLRNAGASNAEDLQMIHHLVESAHGGVDAVNHFVRRAIRESLEVMQTAFMKNVSGVVDALGGSDPDQSDVIEV